MGSPCGSSRSQAICHGHFDAKNGPGPLKRACSRVVTMHRHAPLPAERDAVHDDARRRVALSVGHSDREPPTGTRPRPAGATSVPARPRPGPTVPAPPGPRGRPARRRPTPPGPTGLGTASDPRRPRGEQQNMTHHQNADLERAPAASGWSITGYQVRTRTSTSTDQRAQPVVRRQQQPLLRARRGLLESTRATVRAAATTSRASRHGHHDQPGRLLTFPSPVENLSDAGPRTGRIQPFMPSTSQTARSGRITEVAVLLYDDIVMQTPAMPEGGEAMHTQRSAHLRRHRPRGRHHLRR